MRQPVQRRSRRIQDEKKIKEQQELKREYLRTLEEMTWTEFESSLSEIGVKPGTPQYEEFRMTWRQYQQQRLSEKRSER